MKKIVVSALMALIAAGCSIKEDRSSCPCTLVIDFTGLDIAAYPYSTVRAFSSEALIVEDSVTADRYTAEYSVSVPRTGTWLNLSYGDEGCFRPGKGFVVDRGEEFPGLYMQTELLDTEQESVTLKADLHKAYCSITVRMKSSDPGRYSLTVAGNVIGYAYDGSVSRGAFSYTPELDGDGVCSVRVPRQTDASLMLIIKEDDEFLREFALGEYIVESGYDWSAQDLEDVEIEIDYANTDVSFKINDWETVISFDVII